MLLNKEILTGLYGGGKTNITFNIGWNTSNAAITAYDPLVNENDRPRINTWKSNGTYIVYMSAGYQVYNPVTKTYSTPWGVRTTGAEVVTIPVRTTETAGVDLFIDDRLPLPTLTPDIANWVITDTGNPYEKKYQYSVSRFADTVQYINIGLFERLVWTGLGSNNNWSTSTNWSIRAPQANDSLQFAGTARSTPFNNLPIDTAFSGITFDAGSTAFQLNGNRFVLAYGSITNNSSNVQQINADIVLDSNIGTVNCATSNILLRGNISGNGSLTKIGTSTLSLSGNNTYTGNTYISGGIIIVLNNNALGTGTVFCSGGGGGIQVPSTAAPTNTIINNPIFMDGERPNFGYNIQCQKSATFNGLITVGPNNRTNKLNVQTGATMTINGGISGLPTMGSILTTSGIGTYILSSVPIIFDNTAASGIYSIDGRETVIIAVSGNRFQNVHTGGTLRTDVPFAINNDTVLIGFTPGTVNRSGRINLNGNDQIFRNIRLASNTATFSDISANNIFNNSSTFANLTANNTAGTTYIGSISGNINLIKTGTNTLFLSGSTDLGVGPRYTGFTAISAGTLINYALSSNPSNKVSFAQFTRTTLSITFTTPPSIGDTFILLPGITINSYPAVSLVNATGRTGTYNSTNSTLTIS